MVITIIFGLIALRFAPHSGAPSVPAGARAGDLTLHACTYPTEAGGLAAECGSLVVAENRSRPDSRLIALPVTRLRARSGSAAEPVFFLSGGPGHTNMRFPQADRFTDGRDVVILGYRGIDGSTRLDCPEVERMHRHTADVLDERSFRAYDEAYRTCADRLKAAGIDVSAYGPVQQADDVESARAALGYGRIDVLSESAGTRTALIYAWRYPQNLHRSVMVGANPPGHFMWDPQTADEQLDRYSALCAEDARCRTRTGDLAATMRRTSAALPKHWLFLPIKPSNARLVAWFALGETTSKAGPASAPAMIDTWLAAAEGDPSGLWLASVLGDLMFPELFVWGQSAAVGTTDAWAAGQYFATHGRQEAANFGYAMTAFAWGGGRLAGAWPAAAEADHYQDMSPSEVEILLISGSLDFETPPQNATKDLLPFLPNGHQVVLSGIGHAASFFVDQPEAGTRLITTFFDSGWVDTSLYTAQRTDFRPQLTFTKLAKYVLGTMLAVIALASLSLRNGRAVATAWPVQRQDQRSASVGAAGGMGPRRLVRWRAHRPRHLAIGPARRPAPSDHRHQRADLRRHRPRLVRRWQAAHAPGVG